MRALAPRYSRVIAAVAILVSIVAVGIGLYRERSKAAFKLKSEHTQLSTDVVSEISGYERLETDEGLTKYLVRADHAKTFTDDHLELTNVYLELYERDGVTHDKMSADSAIYIPEEEKNFQAYLKSNVRIETNDGLDLRADDLSYSRRTGMAEVQESLHFQRENVRGRSRGAVVKLNEKRLDLLGDVEIEAFDSAELARSNVRYAKLNAGSATVDQIANKIELTSDVTVNITGKDRSSEINAKRAVVDLAGSDSASRRIRTIELFDEVRISASVASGDTPTLIDAGYALYDKHADRYELKQGAHIVSDSGGKPTDMRASEIVYEQTAGKIAMTGGAELTQGVDRLKGATIHAELFADQKIKHAVIRGDASVHQESSDRTIDLSAPELNAEFAESRQLRDANAIGQSYVRIIPVGQSDYTLVDLAAVRGVGLLFKGEGMIESFKTDGRTTIQLNVPSGRREAANKRLTADSVKSVFAPNGKDIQKAEAVGNAELFIEPLTADRQNYKTTITAARFDCDFFPTGNNAESCTGGKKARAVRVPTVSVEGKGTQTINADTLTAKFGRDTSDLTLLDASGSAKFNELDRNGIARQMTFTQSDQFVRLRGGEPTVWDSRGRARAREIDLDTRNNRSALRGGVSTTYYSQKQIKSSTPFASEDKPVYLTAENAEFDHSNETAVYTGNARGWQDANYVRGNQIFLDQIKGTLIAEGNVQSALYNAKIRQKGRETGVPISASAGTMVYDRQKRLLQYKTSVDIRQGTDRITAGSADVYLNDNNDVSRTVASTNVVITQPTRRASGDWVQYSADDEIAILRGDPATISDKESGQTQAGQLTLSMRENRVVAEGKPKPGVPGRSRSVYKISDLKP